MRRPFQYISLAIATRATSGCAVTSQHVAFSDVQTKIAGRVDQRVTWEPDNEVDAAISDVVRGLLGQQLTADAAVQIALLNNRDLQATFEDLGIARADLVQAGLLRNPMFLAERRFAGQAAELDLMQELVSIATTPLRKRVAGAAFEAAKLRISQVILDLADEARAAFYTLQGGEQMLAMRGQVLQSLSASAELAERMYAAGNITDFQRRTEQRLEHEARLELAIAEEEAVQQRERLNALMGLWGTETTWSVTPRLPDFPASETPLPGLESLAVAKRFDLAAARQDITRSAEALGLTETLRWLPAASLGFHYEHEPDGGVSSIGPSIDLVLPVFDWGQAAVPRDQALLRQKQQRYIALAIGIRSRIRAAYSRMRTARARTEFFHETVLPLQVEILKQSQLQYNAMILGPIQLLQQKEAEIDAGRASIEAQRDYWVARTELEHTLGGAIRATEIGSVTPPPPLEAPAHDGAAMQGHPQKHQEIEP